MERPVGVSVSSFVLGAMAAGLIAGTGMLLSAASQPAQANGWFPGLVALVERLIALMLALLAVWAGVAAAGLLRLRMWARHSAQGIGAGMLGLGLLAIVRLVWFFSHFGGKGFGADGIVAAGIGVAMISLGLAWVVYFSRKSTAAWFMPRDNGQAP